MNVIDKAIEELRGNWWQAGQPSDWAKPGSCIILALDAAAENDSSVFFEGANACAEELGVEEAHELADFNDAPTTTEEDVLLLMKRASARLEADS